MVEGVGDMLDYRDPQQIEDTLVEDKIAVNSVGNQSFSSCEQKTHAYEEKVVSEIFPNLPQVTAFPDEEDEQGGDQRQDQDDGKEARNGSVTQ